MSQAAGPTPELVSCYRSAIYRVLARPNFDLRVDEYSEPLETWQNQYGVNCSALITAANPCSRVLSDSENRRRHGAMLAGLSNWPIIEGINLDPSAEWPEERSALVAGMGECQARRVALAHGQLAWLQIDSCAVPRLLWTVDRRVVGACKS